MPKRLPFASLAAAIGLGFSLLAGSLVAPTVATPKVKSASPNSSGLSIYCSMWCAIRA